MTASVTEVPGGTRFTFSGTVQVSRVAFDVGVDIVIEVAEQGTFRATIYEDLELFVDGNPRRMHPRQLDAEDLAAVHRLLWRPVFGVTLLDDGTLTLCGKSFALRVEPHSTYEAWRFTSPDGLIAFAETEGGFSWNRRP